MFVRTPGLLFLLVIFSASISISYQTDDSVVQVYPNIRVVEPGTDVDFLCNTTLNISLFHWEINDEIVDPSIVARHDDHSMTISMNNVSVRHDILLSTDVVCVSNKDKERKAGAVVYVGYPPLAPRAECLMQNIAILHCRWNNTDTRTSNHVEWQHSNHYDVNYRTTDYNPPIGGKCIVSTQRFGLYYSSCTAKRNDENGWKYRNMVITFNAEVHKFGKSSTAINFTPMENVMLSQPQLKTSQAESNEMGEILEIKADFAEGSDNHFSYCNIDLQVEYTDIPKTFDINRIKQDVEGQFWEDWAANVSIKDDPNLQYFNNSVLISEHSNKLYTRPLPANTNFLLRSKWKITGFKCAGVWSMYTYMTVETDMLPPPSFSQTAILFFKNMPGCSPSSSCNLFPINSNADSKSQAILLWRHTEQSEPIHHNNVYHYEVTNLYDSVLATSLSKSSRNFSLSLNSTDSNFDVNIFAKNIKGHTMSPNIMLESDEEETCRYVIVSTYLEEISSSLLRFKVTWVSSGSSPACSKYDIQDNLKINLFNWKQMLTEDGGNVLDSSANEYHSNGMKRNTLYVEVHNVSTLKAMEKETSIEFQTLDVRNSTAEFYSSFQPYSAYRIAIALSIYDGNTSIQGPAHIGDNHLYYHNIKKPLGTPAEFHCTGVTDSSIVLSWSPVIPQMRNGPIVGYIIYYTTNKNCFAGHGGISRRSPYEFCNKNQVHSKVYEVPVKPQNKNYTDGWYVETAGDANMSITLTNLQPGTSYYVGISAFNAAGTCNCFRQVIQETEKASNVRTILWLTLCVVILLCTIFAMIYLRKAMRLCRGEIPEPECRIPMESTSDIGTKFLDASNYNGEVVDRNSCSHLKQTAFEEPTKMSLLKSVNNNDIDTMLMHIDDQSGLSGIAPYLKPAFATEQIFNDGDLFDLKFEDSLGSDVPCCSSSSNGVKSDSSTRCYESDSDESSIELDNEIYLLPEIALIKCGKAQ